MKLRTMNGIIGGIIAANLIILALCGQGLYVNANNVEERFEYNSNLITLVNNMENTCDLLTENVRSFAVTNQGLDLQLFANELTSHVERENTFQSLSELNLDMHERTVLSAAREKFDALTQIQLNAIRLVVEAFDPGVYTVDPDFYLPELTAKQQALTSPQKIQFARSLVFGSEYRQIKSDIKSFTTKFREMAEQRANNELIRAQAASTNMFRLFLSAIIFLFLTSFALLYLYYFLNSLPITPPRCTPSRNWTPPPCSSMSAACARCRCFLQARMPMTRTGMSTRSP